MRDYTILEFWKPRLGMVSAQTLDSLVQGWSFLRVGESIFQEAPLTQSDEFDDDADPRLSSLLLVSAPGAVGKSTLARQIAYETGSIYVDLAEAGPVGANTLSGGLAKSNLYSAWQSEGIAVLIDGLDEARLKVTWEAFQSFLSDIAEISANRTIPTVLFGRTGAVLDAWLVLTDSDADIAVLEIGYYEPQTAISFAEATVRKMDPQSSHTQVQRDAVRLLLDNLRSQTESDGNRFAGYAPVLQTVAKHVAQESNPGALVARLESGAQPVTLQTVVADILDRERGKLRVLEFEDPELVDSLYCPDEQLDRLVALFYNLPKPEIPTMGPADAKKYSAALDTWVAEHPFLDGASHASSAVFDAMISTTALQSSSASASQGSLQRELDRGAAANPFLAEFYLEQAQSVPAEHIGIIYASLRASLSLGDTANLFVGGIEEAVDEEALRAEIEITISRRDAGSPRTLHFETEQVGTILLGTQVDDVDIVAPQARVEIGPGPEAVLIGPINIQCEHLTISTNKVVVESHSEQHADVVFLEADKYSGEVSLGAGSERRRELIGIMARRVELPVDQLRH